MLAILLTMSALFTETTPRDLDVDGIRVNSLGVYRTGWFNLSSAEISAFDPASRTLALVNGAEGLDLLDMVDPAIPIRKGRIRLLNPTSVAAREGVFAVAHQAHGAGSSGEVHFIGADGSRLGKACVGVGPDMVAWSPDGTFLVVANEGEPSSDGTVDAPGSISIVDVRDGFATASVREVSFAGVDDPDGALARRGLHAPMPVPIGQQLEPEYVAITPDSRMAIVTLQENNALALIDIAHAALLDVVPLGHKEFSREGGLDANAADREPGLADWPVVGLYQPDSVALSQVGPSLIAWTANEGEPREYSHFTEVTTPGAIAAAGRCDTKLLSALRSVADTQSTARGAHAGRTVGRRIPASGCESLEVSAFSGDCDGDGDFDHFVTFGGRSVSGWEISRAGDRWQTVVASTPVAEQLPAGEWHLTRVADSGSWMELATAALGESYNADNRSNGTPDVRSRKRGPEPEGIAIGRVGTRELVFVGLERTSAIAIVEVIGSQGGTGGSLGVGAGLVLRGLGFLSTREAGIDLSTDLDLDRTPDHLDSAGDLGPEGITFVPAGQSPTGNALLLVCYEVSGTVRIWELRAGERIERPPQPG